MRYVLIGISMMVFLVVSLAGFRGDMSRKPPLEVFPDMDRQPKPRRCPLAGWHWRRVSVTCRSFLGWWTT